MKTLRIGTRGSPLAMVQAHETRDRLIAANPVLTVEIVEIKTTGDQVLDRRLSEIGGKGLFTKELDEALLDGRCDIGVHSLKDMETEIHPAIAIGAVLPREDVRDAFICAEFDGLAALPPNSVVGTSSLRRQAQILAQRPDLRVESFRGNVQTRLKKLEAGEAAATMLAMAGLNRLSLSDARIHPIEPEELLPAVAQGAIAITRRKDDPETAEKADGLNDPDSHLRVRIERAFLATLEGSCRTPIAGLALLQGDTVWFRGLTARPDGTGVLRVERRGSRADGEAIGREAGQELLPHMDESYRP
ncbi:MAG: hydroxymethylbilane synthase [Alphaproteobacteria bacterium]|nr:hydroxymethylbilane synthase [Alphaproteobacteria bacterium]